jgi:hypothetical protein
MRDDDTDYTRKSKTYRADYMAATKGLYGEIQDIPLKRTRKPKKRRSITPSEWHCQVALVQWARTVGLLLVSIPNHGKRSYWQGQKEVAAGLTKGVSDLFLAMPRGGLGGYWLEMKRPGGKPTAEQLAWLDKMRGEHYAADWFDDWERARDAIIAYLAG